MDQPEAQKENVTVINTAPANNTPPGDNGLGFLLGIIGLIVVVILFFIYVMPYIRGLSGNNKIQVNVPKSIDVNINQSK